VLRLLPDMRNRPSRQIRWCGLTRVLVTADQLVAEHWPAGIRSRKIVVNSALENLEPLALKAAMAALIKQLPATSWQRMEIYFTDQHVHLMLLPAIQQSGSSSALSSAEQTAYARAMLLKTYGEAALQWPFRLQDSMQSKASLLATSPALQNSSVQNLLAPRNYQQLSVQPYACALWANTQLPANGSVVSAEPHMLRLLQLQQSEVIHVAGLACNTRNLATKDVETISAWLLRERTLLGVQASTCYWLSEPACESVAAVGRRLSQHLAGSLALKPLYSANRIISVWPAVEYVA
jgi:hypothetical protein